MWSLFEKETDALSSCILFLVVWLYTVFSRAKYGYSEEVCWSGRRIWPNDTLYSEKKYLNSKYLRARVTTCSSLAG